jgi:tetratricopeptide (TPR) repeat protein
VAFAKKEITMFSRLFKWLRCGTDLSVPATYDPKLHYNCFVEAVPSQIRQALYKKLRKGGQIRVSHRLPDGRLQLSVSNLRAGLEALNAVGKDKYDVRKLTKAKLIKLMIENPDLELTFVWKPGEMSHVETHRLSELVLGSEEALRKGVSYQERQEYQRAIECYDEAIRIEPLDFRAWNNKIVALSQDGKHQEAIRVADEILNAHPDVAILWNTKGRVLNAMGRQLEAGDCLSRAISLSKRIADNYKIDEEIDEWFQRIINEATQAGKNPETDVDLWFGKFIEYMQSEDVGKGLTCLQMAAKIGPNHCVLSDPSTMALLPPGHPFLALERVVKQAEVTPLRDFYLRFERLNAEALRGK